MHNPNNDYSSVRAIQEVNREIESAFRTPSAWERIPPGIFPIPILVEMIKSGRPWQTATLEHTQWRIDIQLRAFMWAFKAYTSAFVFGFAAHLKPFEDLKTEFDAACGVARGAILRP